MDSYLKKRTKNQDRILQKHFPSGLGLSWDFLDQPDLGLKGHIYSSSSVLSKQALSFSNHLATLKLSADSQKIFKAEVVVLVQKSNLIIPKLSFKANHLKNEYTNQFLMTYLDKPHEAAIGIKNSRVNLFYSFNKIKNFGFALDISGHHDFSDFYLKGALWAKYPFYRFFMSKIYNGNFEASVFYKTRFLNEIAAKIITKKNDVQILLGVLYNIKEGQRFRVRLDSEGRIGVQICNRINEWMEVCAHSDISVKQLAKDHQTFLGFGVRFDFFYKV